jgi:hypothetical protein
MSVVRVTYQWANSQMLPIQISKNYSSHFYSSSAQLLTASSLEMNISYDVGARGIEKIFS